MRNVFLLPILLVFILTGTAHANTLAVDTLTKPQSLLTYIYWLADPYELYNHNLITTPAVQEKFIPLGSRFPVKATGAVWLRFTLTKTPQVLNDGKPLQDKSKFLLDMENLPPGAAEICYPSTVNSGAAPAPLTCEAIVPGKVLQFDGPSLNPLTIYLRFTETPGLWFNPSISPAGKMVPPVLPSDLLLPGVLLVALAVCLLRAIKYRAVWALWSSIFLAGVFIQVVFPLPQITTKFTFRDLPQLLAPGICLILLPHLGRCLLQTSKNASMQDILLASYSLVGVVLALLPLNSDYHWVTRLFPLWPILLIPIFPLCFWALANKRPGALPFAGINLMPIVGACIALYATYSADYHPLAPLGSYWGLAIGGLALALAYIPSRANDQHESAAVGSANTEGLSINTAPTETFTSSRTAEPESFTIQYEPVFGPADTAPLFTVTNISDSAKDAGSVTKTNAAAKPAPSLALSPNQPEIQPSAIAHAQHLETRTPAISQPAGQPTEDKRQLPGPNPEAITLSNQQHLTQRITAYKKFQTELAKQTRHTGSHVVPFNLQTLVRGVHDSIAPVAREKGLHFSWYIAPHMPFLVIGDANLLEKALTLLLQNAVEATDKGAVQLAVHPNPNAPGTCSFLFSINDTGAVERDDNGFYYAWELAQKADGMFNVSHSEDGRNVLSFGINFSLPTENFRTGQEHSELSRSATINLNTHDAETVNLRLTPQQTPSVSPYSLQPTSVPAIILADTATSNRKLLTTHLAKLHCQYFEARDALSAVSIFSLQFTNLVIFDGDMPEVDIADAIHAIRDEEKIRSLPTTPILALTSYDSQIKRMLAIGCTHTMSKPFTQDELIDTINHCLAGLPQLHIRKPEPETESPVTKLQDQYVQNVFEYSQKGAVARSSLQGKAIIDPPAQGTVPAKTLQQPIKAGTAKLFAPPTVPQQNTQDEQQDDATLSHTALEPAMSEKAIPSSDTTQLRDEYDRSAASLTVHENSLAPADSLPENKAPQEITEQQSAVTGVKAASKQETEALPKNNETALMQETKPELSKAQQAEKKQPEQANETPVKTVIPAEQHAQKQPDETVVQVTKLPEATVRHLQRLAHHLQRHQQAAEQTTPAATVPNTPTAPQTQAPVQQSVHQPQPQQEAVVSPAAHQKHDATPTVQVNTAQPTPNVQSVTSSLQSAPDNVESAASSLQSTSGKMETTTTVDEQSDDARTPLPNFDDESIITSLLPLTPNLIYALRDALAVCKMGKESGEHTHIHQATTLLKEKSHLFGLKSLGEIAHQITQAAENADHDALAQLIDDLHDMTERYIASIKTCYNNFLFDSPAN